MYIMKECWEMFPAGLLLKKDSPLSDLLREKVLRIIGKTLMFLL
jgi:hypothetical protein